MAEARMAGVESDRRLVEAMTDIGQRIDSLDDLTHDAYFSQDISTFDELDIERLDITADLVDEELVIHGRELEATDAITLFVTPGQNAQWFAERLVTTYGELARERRWKVTLNLLFLDQLPPPPPKTKARSSKSGKRAEASAQEGRKKKTIKNAPPTAMLSWRDVRMPLVPGQKRRRRLVYPADGGPILRSPPPAGRYDRDVDRRPPRGNDAR